MKRELLYSLTKKDLKLQTFRSGGPGGQNQNKRESGVRITHPASGAVGESREERSQWQNRKNALKRLVENPKFKLWNARVCYEISTGKTLEERVEEEISPKNLKIEIVENGKWKEFKDEKSCS